MDHKERIQVAQGLCDRFVGKYGPDVIVCGVYGSTARGLDLEWSDLEMLFITRDGCKAREQHLVYRGMPITYSVIARSDFEKTLTSPLLYGDCNWPFWMGVLSVLRLLYGKQSQVETWIEMGKAVPYERFRRILQESLPGLIFESYGRIFSCKERNNHDDLYCAVLEVLFEMRDALCFLNKSWATHDYLQGLIDSFQFPKLPPRYAELVPRLWRARGFDEVIPLAKELVESFWQLMAREGISVQDYNHLSDITV
jgi:kanamycin nucleotidyltransferase